MVLSTRKILSGNWTYSRQKSLLLEKKIVFGQKDSSDTFQIFWVHVLKNALQVLSTDLRVLAA